MWGKCVWVCMSFKKVGVRAFFAVYAAHGLHPLKFSFSELPGQHQATVLFSNITFGCRVFVLDKVTDFLLFIGKLVVVGGVGKLRFHSTLFELIGEITLN